LLYEKKKYGGTKTFYVFVPPYFFFS